MVRRVGVGWAGEGMQWGPVLEHPWVGDAHVAESRQDSNLLTTNLCAP